MKKLAIFGASGRTGKILTQLALQNGYQVKALVRTPDTLGLQHPNLQIIKGNILDLVNVEETIHGTEAVVNVSGPVADSPTALQSAATENILRMMRKNNVKRLIGLASVSYGVVDKKDKPGFRLRLTMAMLKFIARARVTDSIRHATLIQESDLDWTVVRALSLDEQPSHNKYHIGYANGTSGNSTTRADVAAFIMDELQSPNYIRQMPLVSN